MQEKIIKNLVMKKIYLTETKNITGNAISDDELLEFAKLEEIDFNKRLKIYI